MSVKSLQKQLLAAIAMVVVAAIAMSSATFAWFVNNSQVTAENVTVTATTSKLLLISTDNQSYGTSTDLGIKLDAMTPVSAGNTLLQNGEFYKVKSWANGTVNSTSNPYGVLATTYVAATQGTDYAVKDIYLKSDVAGSTIALDSSTTQLTATKTVEVSDTSYKIVSTYSAGTISSVVYEGSSTSSINLTASTVPAVTEAGALLEASLGALRIALVPYTGDNYATAGTPIVLTTSTTGSSKGYYNTNNGSNANIESSLVITGVSQVSGTSEYKATLAEDPAAAISTYTATVKTTGEIDTSKEYKTIGTLTNADTPYKWTAYIYIEGCDKDCVSTIAGSVTYGVQLGFIQSVPSAA